MKMIEGVDNDKLNFKKNVFRIWKKTFKRSPLPSFIALDIKKNNRFGGNLITKTSLIGTHFSI